jgi:hypothetical protein
MDSVAKLDFWGKIQKSGVRNSMTYRFPTLEKTTLLQNPGNGQCPHVTNPEGRLTAQGGG